MSNGAIFFLMLGGGGSVGALIAARTSDAHADWRERFMRATWPLWPVMFVVGLVLWVNG